MARFRIPKTFSTGDVRGKPPGIFQLKQSITRVVSDIYQKTKSSQLRLMCEDVLHRGQIEKLEPLLREYRGTSPEVFWSPLGQRAGNLLTDSFRRAVVEHREELKEYFSVEPKE